MGVRIAYYRIGADSYAFQERCSLTRPLAFQNLWLKGWFVDLK